MPATITLSRGERLSLLATAKSNSEVIALDSSWSIAAAIMPNGGAESVDLSPTIALGKVSIDFDTAQLTPGLYVMDIRFTSPNGLDQWSQIINVEILRTVTTFSQR